MLTYTWKKKKKRKIIQDIKFVTAVRKSVSLESQQCQPSNVTSTRFEVTVGDSIEWYAATCVMPLVDKIELMTTFNKGSKAYLPKSYYAVNNFALQEPMTSKVFIKKKVQT